MPDSITITLPDGKQLALRHAADVEVIHVADRLRHPRPANGSKPPAPAHETDDEITQVGHRPPARQTTRSDARS